MRFDWDINKDRTNRRKHGVGFDTAEQVFDDPFATTVFNQFVDDEERWQTVGVDHDQILLVIIHVDRNLHGVDVIRIISARKADSHERNTYEAGH